MATIYTMRALHTPTSKYVSWTSVGSADMTGDRSAYSPSDLSGIIVDYTTSQDLIPITNDAPQFEVNGDLTGLLPSPEVIALRGNPIQDLMPEDGYVLTWVGVDGYWKPKPIVGGDDTEVQFNDAGMLAGDPGLTYDKTNNILKISDAVAVGHTWGPLPDDGELRLVDGFRVITRNDSDDGNLGVLSDYLIGSDAEIALGTYDDGAAAKTYDRLALCANKTAYVTLDGYGTIMQVSKIGASGNDYATIMHFNTAISHAGIADYGAFGSGLGILHIDNAAVVPSTNQSSGINLYSESNTLKYRQPDGTIVTLDGGIGVAGSDTQIQFNDGGTLGGDAGLTYNKTTNVLSLSDALAIGGTPASTGSVRVAGGFTIQSNVGGINRPVLHATTAAEVVIGGFGANECAGVINRISSGAIYNQIAGNNHLTIAASGVTIGGSGVGAALAIGATPASTGTIRLPNGSQLTSRNAANSADYVIVHQDNGTLTFGCDSGANNPTVTTIIHSSSVTRVQSTSNVLLRVGATNVVDLSQTSSDYVALGATPATTGAIRLASTQTIKSRNNGNSANVVIAETTASDRLWLGSSSSGTEQATHVNVYGSSAVNLGIGAADNINISSTSTTFVKSVAITGSNTLSIGTNPASTGNIRMANTQTIKARNAANNADIPVVDVNSSNQVIFGDAAGTFDTIVRSNNISVSAWGTLTLSAGNGNQQLQINGSNFQFGPGAFDSGSGSGVIGIDNASVNPTTNPTSGIVAYVDAGDGYLKYRKADGTIVNLDGGVGAGVGNAGGLDTQVQFNDGGSLGGDPGLTYDKTNNVLSLSDALAVGTNPANAGAIRLANATAINARNAANNANITLIDTNSSNNMFLGYNSAGSNKVDGVYVYPQSRIQMGINSATKLDLTGTGSDFIALGASPASAGVIRLPSAGDIKARNAGNTADWNLVRHSGGSSVFLGDVTFGSATQVEGNSVNIYASGATRIFNKNGSGYAMQLDQTSSDYLAFGTNPASAGVIRLAKGIGTKYRNNANNANITAFISGATNDALFIGQNEAGGEQPTATAIAGAYVSIAAGATQKAHFQGTGSDFIALGASPAAAGAIRLGNNININARNAADNADIRIAYVTSSDGLVIGTGTNPGGLWLYSGTTGTVTSYLADGHGFYNVAGSPVATLTSGGFIVNGAYQSIGSNPAASGTLRLANNVAINFRNGANNGDVQLGSVTASDNILIGHASNAGDIYLRTSASKDIIHESSDHHFRSADGLTPYASIGNAYISLGTNPAGSQQVRLPNTGGISIRNAANSDDLIAMTSTAQNQIIVGGGNVTQVGGKVINLSTIGHRLTDQGTGTTLYLKPFTSSKIALYSTTYSQWFEYEATEITTSLSLTGLLSSAGNNFDVYAYWNGTNVALEVLFWGSNTRSNPNANPTTLNGVLVKANDSTRRYIGTIRSTGSGSTADTQAQRFIWNYYNRVQLDMVAVETANSWTYSGAARPYNNNTATRLEWVIGDPQFACSVDITAMGMARHTASDWGASVDIGIDSTSTGFARLKTGGYTIANAYTHPTARYVGNPGFGYHYAQMLERSGTTVTFYGDNNDPTYFQCGILGWLMG